MPDFDSPRPHLWSLLDIQSALVVEIEIDSTGKIWVNVDGKCALRIGHAGIIATGDPVDGYRQVHPHEKG